MNIIKYGRFDMGKRLNCSILLLFGFFSILNITAYSKDASEIARNTFPSVVMIVMEDKNGQPLSLGSGFFVKNDIVATNLHVVEDSVGGYVKLVGQKDKYNIAGYVAVDPKMDLILLKISDVNLPSVAIGDSSKMEIGNEIFAIGNPKGLEGTFSQGIISAIRKSEENSLFQITAPISPGSSGGPILNRNSEVIGVSVATFQGGQNLNFAIPSKYLSNLISNVKPVEKLSSQENKGKGIKSILSDSGSRNSEGVIGEKLTWENQLYDHFGGFSFTLRNQLRESVKDVICLVIFYDSDGQPLDITLVDYPSIIPGNLAKRVNGSIDKSIKRLTTKSVPDNQYMSSFVPSTKVEIRILTFQFVENEN